MQGNFNMANEINFDNFLSKRGNLEHPWSTITPPPEGTISFVGGIPDPETLPLEQIQEAANHVLTHQGISSLQYAGSFGDITLREEITKRILLRHNVELSPENIVLTTGSSQALDIVCAAFINPGDVIISETPTFTGSIWTMHNYGAEIIPLPIETDGIDIQNLHQTLKSLKAKSVQPKFIYVTPDFQNPTGNRLSLNKRKQLLILAEEFNTFIVEDTAYADIVIDGPGLPSLLTLNSERVVQMSTFSKIVAPGLRIGWLCGARNIVNHASLSRTDMGSSVVISRIIAQFMRQGSLEPHIEKMKNIYREKRDSVERSLNESLHGMVSWEQPQGGFLLWLETTENIDVTDLWNLAREEGVGFAPGFRFNVNSHEESKGMRLAFIQVSLENIPEGIQRLARAFEKINK
jgi:2-aminoadipate transaminase